MTTAERFRRRQRIELALVLLVGLALIASSAYFAHRDRVQRDCIAANFSRLSTSLSERGDLSSREASVSRAESQATRRLFKDAFASKTQAQIFGAYGRYRIALHRIDERRVAIEAGRTAHPIPDFPEGTCD